MSIESLKNDAGKNDLLVEVTGFSKDYGSGKNVFTACSGVDFTARRGQITGILGPNGAGKSTLLKALCGVHYASSGSVRVCGSEDAAFIRSVTGYVPETPELDGRLTVAETLVEEASIHGLCGKELEKSVEKAVKTAALKDVLLKKVSALSKGYRQRTSLAKALSFNPELLILDEFSGGLDPAQIVSMRNSIKKLSQSRAIVFSTHHIDEAQSLCDFIYIMNGGRVVASGTIEQVVARSGKASLEQAFLAFTGETEE